VDPHPSAVRNCRGGGGAFLAGETQRASDIETTVTRGDIVLSISAVGRFRPIAMVEIDRLEPAQTARVSVDALPDRQFEGAVTQIRRLSDDSDGVVTYRFILSAQTPDLILMSGMTAILDIVVAERRDVLAVPNAALRFRPGDAAALLAQSGQHPPQDGTVRTVWKRGPAGHPTPVFIATGLTDGTAPEVLSGKLAEGDSLVIGRQVTREARGLFGLNLGL